MSKKPLSPRRRCFTYTYDDLAVLFGWNRDQVMRTARAGKFNPADIASVLEFADAVRVGLQRPTAPRYGKRKHEATS